MPGVLSDMAQHRSFDRLKGMQCNSAMIEAVSPSTLRGDKI